MKVVLRVGTKIRYLGENWVLCRSNAREAEEVILIVRKLVDKGIPKKMKKPRS